ESPLLPPTQTARRTGPGGFSSNRILAFHPAGPWLFVRGGARGFIQDGGAPAGQPRVRLVSPGPPDVPPGEEMGRQAPPPDVDPRVAFSPDGSRVAVVTLADDGGVIARPRAKELHVLHVSTGTTLRTIPAAADWYPLLAWGPGGKWLGVVETDGETD